MMAVKKLTLSINRKVLCDAQVAARRKDERLTEVLKDYLKKYAQKTAKNG